MLSHMVTPEKVLQQAKLMEAYGADVVYVVVSAGAMLPDDVKKKVGLLKNNLAVEVGFHAHNNLGLAIGNTVAAIEEGASVVDGCLHTFRAAEKFGLDPRDILLELGRRKVVGGQEDMIVDVSLAIKNKKVEGV